MMMTTCLTPGFMSGPQWIGPEPGQPPTITITPFYFSRADIKPSQYVPIWWSAYPPSRKDFEWVFELGYKVCLRPDDDDDND